MKSTTKKSVCLPPIGWDYDAFMRKIHCYPYDAYCILISEIPCGMIVTDRGHLLQWKDKEFQKKMLESEGLTICCPNPNRESYVVSNYKKHLFDFDSLHITARVHRVF